MKKELISNKTKEVISTFINLLNIDKQRSQNIIDIIIKNLISFIEYHEKNLKSLNFSNIKASEKDLKTLEKFIKDTLIGNCDIMLNTVKTVKGKLVEFLDLYEKEIKKLLPEEEDELQ